MSENFFLPNPPPWVALQDEFYARARNLSENASRDRRENERRAFHWLATRYRLDFDLFLSVLQRCRSKEVNKNLYTISRQQKRNGGIRITYKPCKDLLLLQKTISRNILRNFSVPDCVSGFSGGSVQ